ncbi:MAG TPA: DUF1643 domain-containing protein [Candidatus Acidoferrales bacterium]|nr:DUF1643 domain-containing protein [Candidatus Acidoferrales bacterium]
MDTLFECDGNAAVISECGRYRYSLTRRWGDGNCVTWLMLNPSTADANIDDATIRKCIGFSKRWGYARMIVVNLFGLRSTDPRALAKSDDPVGPQNDWYLHEAFMEGHEVICAWGCTQHLTTGPLRLRIGMVLSKIPTHHSKMCLGRRKDGAPRHPLMLPYSTPLQPL